MMRPATPRSLKRAVGLAHAQERAREVDAHRLLPARDVDLVRGAHGAGHARVVDQQVEPAPGVGGRPEQGRHRVGLGDVGRDDERLAESLGRLVQRLPPTTREGDPPPVVEQGPADHPAEARPGPGDDGGARCGAHGAHPGTPSRMFNRLAVRAP